MITGGATITVEAGTRILLSVGASLTVKTDGRLLAVGTEDAMITFGPSVPGTVWGGLIIEDTTQASYVWDGGGGGGAQPAVSNGNMATVLIYCALTDGGDSTRGFKGAIRVNRGTPFIQDCVSLPPAAASSIVYIHQACHARVQPCGSLRPLHLCSWPAVVVMGW